MLLGPGINASRKKANYHEINSQLSHYNSSAIINNVKVKNTKSAGFTQLERKLFQQLDDLLLDINVVLSLPPPPTFFLGGSMFLLFLTFLETLFFDESFLNCDK